MGKRKKKSSVTSEKDKRLRTIRKNSLTNSEIQCDETCFRIQSAETTSAVQFDKPIHVDPLYDKDVSRTTSENIDRTINNGVTNASAEHSILNCRIYNKLGGVAAEIQLDTTETEDNKLTCNTSLSMETNLNTLTNVAVQSSTERELMLEEHICSIDLITPQKETSPLTTSKFEFSFESNEILPIKSHAPTTQSVDALSSSVVVEIIDVDKLPDRPDSPVGDDVVEVLLPLVSDRRRSSRLRRSFVDLTDLDETTSQSVCQVGFADHYDSSFSSHNGQLSEEEQPNILDVTVSTTAPATTVASVTPLVATTTVTQSQRKIKIGIFCPICMDDADQIADSKRQLMSTPCGHVFCDDCVNKALAKQNVCPACRKKVSKKRLHPIFI